MHLDIRWSRNYLRALLAMLWVDIRTFFILLYFCLFIFMKILNAKSQVCYCPRQSLNNTLWLTTYLCRLLCSKCLASIKTGSNKFLVFIKTTMNTDAPCLLRKKTSEKKNKSFFIKVLHFCIHMYIPRNQTLSTFFWWTNKLE